MGLIIKNHHRTPASAIFSQIDEQTYSAIIDAGRNHELPHRGAIISGEELSQRFYLLLNGHMKILRPVICGEEALQQQLHAGDVLCTVAMLGAGKCLSYAASLCSCQLLSWSHRQFRSFIEQEKQLRENLFMLMVNQVDKERHKCGLMQCANLRGRVAAALLTRVNDDGVVTDNTGATIDLRPISLTAQELGMARETLSRILSAFEHEGIIAGHRGLIQVRKLSRIQMIVDGTP
jgi:CRP-like cAMP-binding protein